MSHAGTDAATTELIADLQHRLRLLEDERDVRTTLVRMVTLVDCRAWEDLFGLFTPNVYADWNALSGVPAAEVASGDLVAAVWIDGTQFDFYDHEPTVNAAVDHAVTHFRRYLQ